MSEHERRPIMPTNVTVRGKERKVVDDCLGRLPLPPCEECACHMLLSHVIILAVASFDLVMQDNVIEKRRASKRGL